MASVLDNRSLRWSSTSTTICCSVELVSFIQKFYSTYFNIIFQVIHKTRFPRWQKEFNINFEGPLTMDSIVTVVIWDKDPFSKDDFMGEVEIDISELEVGTTYKNWYRLQQHCSVEPTTKQ